MEGLRKRIEISILLQLLLAVLIFDASGSPMVENRNCGKGNCHQKGFNQKGYKVCDTKECYKIAESYKKLLNFSASPCDDFYAFTCGDNSTGTLRTLINSLPETIKELLVTPSIDTPKGHFDNVKAFYQGCLISANASKEDIISAAKTALRNTGGMPLISNTDYEPGLSWERRLGIFLRQSKKNPLFGISLAEKQSLIVIMHIAEYLLLSLLSVKESPESIKKINLWKALAKSQICFLRGENQNCQQDKEIDEEITKILQFEKKLIEMFQTSGVGIDFIFSPEKNITMKELTETFPEFNWLDFLKEMFKETELSMPEKTRFLIPGKKVLKDLFIFIANTEKKTIENYLGLFTINMIPMEYTNAFRVYSRPNADLKILQDAPMEEILHNLCYEDIKKIFPYSVARIYSEKYFNQDHRKQVIAIIYALKQALANTLVEKDWMDKETKREAIRKVNNMETYIGYPVWIWDDNEIVKRESMPDTNAKKFFHSSLVKAYHYKQFNQFKIFLTSNTTNKTINMIDKDTELWTGGPASFQLQYYTMGNIIQIAAGAFRSPLYNADSLSSLNYGGLGFTLGHEMTHGFDVNGIQHDAFGRKRPWMSAEDIAEYHERIQCYSDLFSSIVDDLTNLTLNGNKSLEENMSDLGGIRRAYDSYKKLRAEDMRLPGLESINDIQLFFISFGRLFCEEENFDKRKETLLHDVHSPAKYRILLTMKNFQPFAEAFSCPKGSTMNPEKRCPMS